MTHLGGFFIKRKLDSSVGKDILYRKCLHEVRREMGEMEGGVPSLSSTAVHGEGVT